MNLTNVLPVYLKESLLCFTLVNSKAVDGAPEIATCNTNGYMYEVKNRKILHSLNLFNKGSSMSCCYLLQNEKLTLYYIILTESHKLLIIMRTNVSLQIMKTYDQVKEFDVYDHECLGFPQIKINFLNLSDNLIWSFPVETKAGTAEDDRILIDQDDKSSSFVESLEEKLQILSKHIDELSEEYNLLRRHFLPKELPTPTGMIPVGPVKFSLPLKRRPQPIVKVCGKWIKVFGSSLILGMKIFNSGCETIRDLELFISHEHIKDYSYRIFHSSDDLHSDLFSPPKARSSVRPGEEVCAVGAFRVPPFLSHSTLSVSCCLTASDLNKCLLRESFEVAVLDIASRSSDALEEGFTVEDLMAMRTARSETHLQIRTEDLDDRDGIRSTMVDKLAFTKVKHTGDELFYCTSTYLNEVVAALRRLTKNPSLWEMLLLTSEDAQVYFLVNALYDLLPENTEIWSKDDTFKAKKAHEEALKRLKNWKEIEKLYK